MIIDTTMNDIDGMNGMDAMKDYGNIIHIAIFNNCLKGNELCVLRCVSKETKNIADEQFKLMAESTVHVVPTAINYIHRQYVTFERGKISIKKASEKWKLPQSAFSMLDHYVMNMTYRVVSIDKYDAFSIALEHHGGPKKLLEARYGKSKYKRYMQLLRETKSTPQPSSFQNTIYVETFLKNGSGGVKGLRYVVAQWTKFMEYKTLHPDIQLRWFNEDIDHPEVAIEKAAALKLNRMRRNAFESHDVIKSCAAYVWTQNDFDTFVDSGDTLIFDQISQRQKRLDETIPHHLHKYVMDVNPDYILKAHEDTDIISKLENHEFLIKYTPYAYYLKKMRVKESRFRSREEAIARALRYIHTNLETIQVPISLQPFIPSLQNL